MDIFTTALQQYTELFDLSDEVERLLAQPATDKILRLVQRIDQVRKDIRQTDALINGMDRAKLSIEQQEKFEARITLMEKISEKSRFLVLRIQNIMAVKTAELEQIQQGRRVMLGYTCQAKKAGGIINTTN